MASSSVSSLHWTKTMLHVHSPPASLCILQSLCLFPSKSLPPSHRTLDPLAFSCFCFSSVQLFHIDIIVFLNHNAIAWKYNLINPFTPNIEQIHQSFFHIFTCCCGIFGTFQVSNTMHQYKHYIPNFKKLYNMYVFSPHVSIKCHNFLVTEMSNIHPSKKLLY